MTIPSTLTITEVQDLEFVRISDHVRPNQWVEWEVRFTFQGFSCEGFVMGCPSHPTLSNEGLIENIETI